MDGSALRELLAFARRNPLSVAGGLAAPVAEARQESASA